MPEPSASDEQRLDEVFDPSRLQQAAEHDAAARVMPWERPGVVMDDQRASYPVQTWIRTGKRRWLLFAIGAGWLLIFLALPLVLSRSPGYSRALVGPILTLLAVAPFLAALMWLMHRARKAGRAFVPPVGWVFFGLACVTSFGLVVVGAVPQMSTGAVMPVLVALGFGMLTPLRPRVGDELRCAKCQYEYVFGDRNGPEAPEQCSECGAPWHESNGLVRGRKAKPRLHPWALFLLFAVLLFGVGFVRTPLLSVMPTRSLIRQVTAPRAGFVQDEWNELSTRTLSPDQRLRLARGLLDVRLAEQSLPAEADAWLDAEIVAGRLPPELVDRYHREMFDATLYGPQRVRVWETAVFGLGTLERGYPFAPRDAYLAIRGFSSDDDPATLRATQNTLLYGSLAGGRSAWLGAQTARPGGVEAPFTFETPGTRRITCVYWLVVLPQNTPAGPITWNADGTPNLPAGTLFSERREIWVEVEVAP